MKSILIFQQLQPISQPIVMDDICRAVEYLYRVPCEAVALIEPASDSEGVTSLSLLSNLPLEHQLRIFMFVEEPPRYRLSMQVECCFYLPMEYPEIIDTLARYGAYRVVMPPSDRLVERRCSELLLTLGIPAHLRGFQMLRIGMQYLLDLPPTSFPPVMSELYPFIAEKTHTSVSVVEHSMRTAIDTAWLRADLETLEAYFGYSTKPGKSSPSNSAFLYTVVDRIRCNLERSTHAISKHMHRYDLPYETHDFEP